MSAAATSSIGRISIVIPVLDEATLVVAALDAFAAWRAEGAEVVVVDGQSRDGTAAAASAGADRVVVVPRGRARQMNAGAAAARGEILVFLHVDTSLPPCALDTIAAALDATRASAGRRAECVEWGRFDVEISGRGRLLKLVAALMNWRSRLSGIATGDQAMFMTRAAFDRVGGFPEQPLMEDVELSRRLLRRVGRPACLHERVVTSGRRWQAHGTCRTIVLMWSLRLLYRLGVAPERLARGYR